MSLRLLIPGIIAGIICRYVQILPGWDGLLAKVDPAWPQPFWSKYEQTAYLLFIAFCALVIFIAGWIAARWNWAKSWQQNLLDGASAGLVAGCILYDFIGAKWVGANSHIDVLQTFYIPVTDKNYGTLLLFDAISNSAQIYLYVGVYTVPAALIAGLGGLVSMLDNQGWGKPVEDGYNWLHRLPAYTLVFSGVVITNIILILTSMLIQWMIDATTNMIPLDDFHKMASPLMIIFAPMITGFLLTLFPAAITWGWASRAWKNQGIAGHIASTLWIVTSLGLVAFATNLQGSIDRYTIIFSMIQYSWLFLVAPPIIGFFIGRLAGSPAQTKKPSSADWVGYMLAQGILSGTQAFALLLAYPLTLTFLTVSNIPQLTMSGIAESTPYLQVESFYTFMDSVALGTIIAFAVFSLLVAELARLIRAIIHWAFRKDDPAPLA